MLAKLARRLGFQQSVPVSLIDDWVIPSSELPLIELAPREGAASCLVDEFGRLQIAHASWSLDLTLAAGARWVPAANTAKVKQRLLAPAVIETEIETPSGPVLQRVAAAVVDGKPVAIIEIENTGGVAIAVAMVARPLRHGGRGSIGEAHVDRDGMTIDAASAVKFATAPASVKAIAGADGDLLQALPAADDPTSTARAACRSAGAQVAAVWPLAHTATLRAIVELDQPTPAGSPVPSTNDVNRGWTSHLAQGMRVDIDGLSTGEDVAVAARSLLTQWPAETDRAAAILALSELGFGRDAARLFAGIERDDDPARLVLAFARWAQLGEATELHLAELDSVLGPLARAAHDVVNSHEALNGPTWLPAALAALGARLDAIEQSDVADRIRSIATTDGSSYDGAGDQVALLSKSLTARGVWPDNHVRSSARFVIALRSLIVADGGDSLQLLPEIPAAWRGRPIDVFGVPVERGSLSFGLRWHGPRPAVLWQVDREGDSELEITVPGIDSSFASTERAGEALLADPGWKTS